MAVADAPRSDMPTALRARSGAWAQGAGKRAMDVVLAACGLIVLGIPLLVLGALVRATSPGPAVYGAQRVGLHGQTFRMYKLRSMVDGADSAGPLITVRGRPARHEPWVDGCAEQSWTSCRHCGMCLSATCRWSARGLRIRTRRACTPPINGEYWIFAPASPARRPSGFVMKRPFWKASGISSGRTSR